MNDDHLPKDPNIIEAWKDCKRSLESMADFTVHGFAFHAREKRMTPIEEIVYYALQSRMPWESISSIKAQEPIGKYRVDFLVEFEKGFNRTPENCRYIIECDGHDFHERTKEQAQHDKQRDRELQALGFKVYRFTGSEIWKSRGQCVIEALDISCA